MPVRSMACRLLRLKSMRPARKTGTLCACRGMVSSEQLVLLGAIGLVASFALSSLGAGIGRNVSGQVGGQTVAVMETGPLSRTEIGRPDPAPTPSLRGRSLAAGTGFLRFVSLVEELALVDGVQHRFRLPTSTDFSVTRPRFSSESTIAAVREFNALPEATRKAALEDWRGAVLYGAYQPDFKGGEIADRVMATSNGQWKDVLDEFGVRHDLVDAHGKRSTTFHLGRFLEALSDARRLDELSDPQSAARRALRLHGLGASGSVDYRQRFVPRAALAEAFVDFKPGRVEGMLLLAELEETEAVRAAQMFAAPGTSNKWVEHQVQWLSQQARLEQEIARQEVSSSRNPKALGAWWPDASKGSDDMPWEQRHLTFELNRRLPFRLSDEGEALRDALQKWGDIPNDDVPRVALAELVRPALEMFHESARLQEQELVALVRTWGDAPLLDLSDMQRRIERIGSLAQRANALLAEDALSKQRYLKFVDEYIVQMDELTVLRRRRQLDPRPIFGPDGQAATLEAMPLFSQGLGYWTFADAYEWMRQAVDLERRVVREPTLPLEIPLSGRFYDGNFDTAKRFAEHDIVHVKGVRRTFALNPDVVLDAFDKIDAAERRLANTAPSSKKYDELAVWITRAKSKLAYHFWEGSRGRPDFGDPPN